MAEVSSSQTIRQLAAASTFTGLADDPSQRSESAVNRLDGKFFRLPDLVKDGAERRRVAVASAILDEIRQSESRSAKRSMARFRSWGDDHLNLIPLQPSSPGVSPGDP
jgi:hypothetical protein